MTRQQLEERLSQVALYKTDGMKIREVLVVFWHPFSRWAWYVVEAEKQGDDWLLFTWCQSGFGEQDDEWGYVLLSQLEEVKEILKFIPINWQITDKGEVLS